MCSLWSGLTFAVLLGLLYLLNKRMKGTANVVCPSFFMNSTTLHPELHLSEMDTVLSNYKISEINSENEEKQFKRFKGVVSKNPLNRHKNSIFEVGFTFDVIADVGNNQVLFQVGVAKRDLVDLDATLGIHEQAWSIAAVGCENQYICLIAQSDGKDIEKLPISENKINSTVSKKIIFQCIPSKKILMVSINTPEHKFVQFEDIALNKDLRSALAIYNPTLARTTLTVLQTSSLELDITTLHRLIFMSEDNNTISNFKVNEKFTRRNNRGNLIKYKGVIGDVQFNRKFYTGLPEYFEVIAAVDVIAYDTGTQGYIFEIGFTRQHLVDRGNTIRYLATGWVICAKRCKQDRNAICLQTWHDGQMKEEFSIYNLGRSKRYKDEIVLGFVLDSNRGTIKFSKRSPKKHIGSFNNVPFSKGIYPVFGIDYHQKVSLRLQTAESISRFSLFGYHFKTPVCLL
ncbi:uncharacterized protein LOC133188769 [Saccostrea echinata]|uniref:uncharacterized protein LOC133188769 n=1 Tax=Saccostrea echinata TaxID=191078 RepID=UPI002A80533B|nr:uncharacterized protein LOC133188769 [Saccostrea echinata]